MVNEMGKICGFLTLALLAGCVSVKNENALVPPTGLVANFRAPLTLPRGGVPCDGLKVGRGSRSLYLKEWVYSGISVEVCDMALQEAIADAGIKQLYFADYEQYSILGFVTVFTVTAYGK